MEDIARLGAQQFMTVDAFGVELTEGPDSAIVVKDHSGPLGPQGRTASEHADAIGREIAWLAAAQQIPGVVRLATESNRDGVTGVQTVFGGGRTLRSDCPDEPSAALVLADVCHTLEALHTHDLTHGSLTPEHIIVRPDLSTLLCSPNTSGQPTPDLQALGRCIEFVTEQWAKPSARIEQWLVLAKRLRDGDETLSPARVAQQLEILARPAERTSQSRTRQFTAIAVLALAGVGFAGFLLATSSESTLSGPELEVDGLIVQVGERGQIAVARPSDRCGSARVYLLDPKTFRIWTFAEFRSGNSGTALAMVPGATDLQLSVRGECTEVLAKGPAGAVALD